MSDSTPMMVQYRRVKESSGDAILFFRLGDFYEMFEEDAKEASRLLSLTLTKRNGIPMCGLPYHAANTYIAKLLKFGKKIAICEQLTEPGKGKSIVERGIVQVLSPGTVFDEEYLNQGDANYLAAVGVWKSMVSFSYVDGSTGEFQATSFPVEARLSMLRREIGRLGPKEIIIQESLYEEDGEIAAFLNQQDGLLINRFPDWNFDVERGADKLKRQFGVVNLKAFGLTNESPELFTAGTLLEYCEDSAKTVLHHIRDIRVYTESDFMGLDETTQKNLEIVRNLQDGSGRFTLLETLNFTKTSMGLRKLKSWLLAPLVRKQEIEQRISRVESLYRNQTLLLDVRNTLSGMLDLERLCARIATHKAHAKDLLGVRQSLYLLLTMKEKTSGFGLMGVFLSLSPASMAILHSVTELLEISICDDPSILLTEGNLIKDGYSEELDRLKDLKNGSQRLLDDYLKTEKEKSGIANLKIRYNRIIGYYLEVTKGQLSAVPSHFIRRQSLVNGERYSTEQLAALESELQNASDKLYETEKTVFLEVRDKVRSRIPEMKEAARHIAELDCFASYAFAATVHGYSKPDLEEMPALSITEGRHPVVEKHLPPGEFVANSICLDPDNDFFALITGPNMAGKSTFLRQVALIVLMAQAGSFVPAREAKIGITDNIFCRVGASDNLARGESTFLVEMSETARILRSATRNSLIIMDEIGRGTSSEDGLAIAGAVMRYILEKIGAKTLFATHFHELTKETRDHLLNLSMEVLEDKENVVFMKKVRKGAADNSYGIHVARLAGLPEEVLYHAKIALNNPSPARNKNDKDRGMQGELFSSRDLILEELASLSLDTLTPLNALLIIDKWKKYLHGFESA